jgi:hypothetical protein
MAKSSFNLHASNAAFATARENSSVASRDPANRAAGGPHFELQKGAGVQSLGKPSNLATSGARGWRHNLRAIVVTAALTAAFVAAFWLSRPWQRHSLAQRWEQDLHEAADDIALARVPQLGQLGPSGVRVLGQAVGVARENVARAARSEVASLLAHWELEDARTSSPLIAALAEGMAASIESFDAEARRFAADTAQRLLIWPVDRNTVNRAPLIAACETVLLAVGRPATPARSPKPAAGATGSAAGATGSASAAADSRAPSPEARLLPSSIGISPLPRVPAEADVEVSDDEVSPPPSAKTPQPADEPSTSEESQDPKTPPRQLSRAVTAIDDDVIALDEPPASRRVNPGGSQAAWMRDLNSTKQETVALARAELSKLGLSSTELELARLATHADPAVRKRLARAIPRLPNIDARGWLEFLCEDPDPEVRRTAQTLLATTGDPQAVLRLRQGR